LYYNGLPGLSNAQRHRHGSTRARIQSCSDTQVVAVLEVARDGLPSRGAARSRYAREVRGHSVYCVTQIGIVSPENTKYGMDDPYAPFLKVGGQVGMLVGFGGLAKPVLGPILAHPAIRLALAGGYFGVERYNAARYPWGEKSWQESVERWGVPALFAGAALGVGVYRAGRAAWRLGLRAWDTAKLYADVAGEVPGGGIRLFLKYPIPAFRRVLGLALQSRHFRIQTINQSEFWSPLWRRAAAELVATGQTNDYTRLLAAQATDTPVTTKMARKAFSAVQKRLEKILGARGMPNEITIHHWNYTISEFRDIAVDPRNLLVPIPRRDPVHALMHALTSSDWRCGTTAVIDSLHMTQL